MERNGRQPAFAVETGLLRPGVPVVQARGRLNRATAVELRSAVERCFDTSPWAVVVDLTGLSAMRPTAMSTLAGLAERAGGADIGLLFVTDGNVVDDVLTADPRAELFDVHHTVRSAERALGGRC